MINRDRKSYLFQSYFLLNMLLLLIFASCKESTKDRINRLVSEWTGKEILFPDDIRFSMLGNDTVNLLDAARDYAIVLFSDSAGCINCRLQLDRWKSFLAKRDTMFQKKVELVLIVHPNNRKDMVYLLEEHHFTHPVFIDMENSFYKLNHLPDDEVFQAFLLDRDNKVVAIGNPVHNPKVQELFVSIINGEKIPAPENKQLTTFSVNKLSADLGEFDWQQEQQAEFVFTNTGNRPLVIIDVATSCGCTTVDFPKEPIQPGKVATLLVKYKADRPEHFAKMITVHCNAEASLIQLKINGTAQ